jgi:NADH-quinone oxidoreductase subunit G
LEDLVTITVDNQEMQVPKGTLLWEACKSHGIDIPIFCYHTKLGPVGACRTCLVEQEGIAKGPITACSTPVSDGMKIRTRSPVVQKAQKGIFEFLLLNHPLDCPICDRGGECPLQDQTFAYGPGSSRYVEPKRHHVKPIPLGPTIALDRERCVLCWRCVRFTAEIAEDKSIVLLDRGDHSSVGTFQDEPYISNFSGNVVELCPVGALTSRKQRFHFRPWELQNRPSICPHCPMGCNINVSVRKNDEVIRFLSRDNPEVDNSWLCDRGRYNFEFINSPERLKSPLLRRDKGFVEVSWDEALGFIAGRVKQILADSGAEAIVGIASPRLSNEDMWVFKRFMNDVIGSNAIDHFPRPPLALTGSGERAMNRLDEALMPISELRKAKTILLLGADPSAREPVLELHIREAVNKLGVRLAIVSSYEITLSSKAHATLSYPSGQFEQYVRALASSIADARDVVRSSHTESGKEWQASGSQIREFAEKGFAEGPVAVIYDDTFKDMRDPSDALEAIAELIEVLAELGSVATLPMLDDCNSMGARDLGLLPPMSNGGKWGPPLTAELMAAPLRVRGAFVLGSNLVEDLQNPELIDGLRGLDLLVVSELMLTDTARLADVILPAASFAEKAGTFTNTERRIQRIAETVPSPGIARSDWEMLVDLSQYFDQPLDFGAVDEVWDDIRRSVTAYSDISYEDVGLSGVRPGAASLQPV